MNKQTLIHTRDEAEFKTLTDLFLNTAGIKGDKVIHGLSMDSQVELRMAALAGSKVITTGLPVDIASNLPQGFTQIRAWDITKPGGSRSMGVNPPADFVVVKVANQAAFTELLQTELYKQVIGEIAPDTGDEPPAEDGAPEPF